MKNAEVKYIVVGWDTKLIQYQVQPIIQYYTS